MEFKIKPYSKNRFPLKGVLIKSSSVADWINAIQSLRLPLAEIKIYPLPDRTPNSIWGCVIISIPALDKIVAVSKYELCQMVTDHLLIPERSILSPSMTEGELQQLFSSGIHIVHPEFGMVALSEEIELEQLLIVPSPVSLSITTPVETVHTPKRVHSFQVHRLPVEEVLKNLTDNIFPRQEQPKDDSLNLWEKVKLAFYRTMFSQQKSRNSNTVVQETSLGKGLKAFLDKILNKGPKWEGLQKDFEDLEARNQKQVDKLMDLLKKNPDEALKYAIPLDENGVARGKLGGQLDLSKRWFDFSLFGSPRSQTGSGTVNLGDSYYQLQNQYIATAEELLKKNEHQKAAFIFMKLLKNYDRAAAALEAGRYYQEAATIYIKHSGNKLKAAQCYEKGNLTLEAIDLYKELNEHEKAGDLYIKINQRTQAMMQYHKLATHYKAHSQYLKASSVYREKMDDARTGQSLLLEGWNSNKDATNCLSSYFSNVKDIDERWKDITSIYTHHTSDMNKESFLEVLKREYKKKNELTERLRELAYEVVAYQLPQNPGIATELKDFNPNNTELRKDAIRFKMKKK